VVDRQESPGTIGFSLRPGTQVNVFTSGSGHVLLAFADEDIAEAILADGPDGVDTDALGTRLQQVRRQGYEVQNSARVKGVRDVRYPIFGFGGRLVAALTIPYVTFIDGSRGVALDDTREMLPLTAQTISEERGDVGRAPRP
jgi:DNA-binding IclR family transcriptional regulator